jgi:hypothetical protein
LSLLMAATAALCLAQFPPPSDSGQFSAKALTMSGQVSVQRDTVLIGLSVGDLVQVQQMIVTGPDGHAMFQVSDGSTFEVFPNSHLVFRKNAWNPRDFIDLLVGRIRVHIEHLGNIPNPNHVLTPTAVISVRGTTFDVTVGEDDETTTVEVEDGLVSVRHALLPSDHEKMLGPGDSIKVYKNEPLQAGLVDKGAVWRYLLQAVRDAANVASMRATRGVIASSGGGSGAGSVGDSGKTQAPPTAPTAPTPPPPPGFVDSSSANGVTLDAGAAAPARPQHRSKAATIGHAAKKTVLWLGQMTGVYTPAYTGPMKAHPIF